MPRRAPRQTSTALPSFDPPLVNRPRRGDRGAQGRSPSSDPYDLARGSCPFHHGAMACRRPAANRPVRPGGRPREQVVEDAICEVAVAVPLAGRSHDVAVAADRFLRRPLPRGFYHLWRPQRPMRGCLSRPSPARSWIGRRRTTRRSCPRHAPARPRRVPVRWRPRPPLAKSSRRAWARNIRCVTRPTARRGASLESGGSRPGGCGVLCASGWLRPRGESSPGSDRPRRQWRRPARPRSHRDDGP